MTGDPREPVGTSPHATIDAIVLGGIGNYVIGSLPRYVSQLTPGSYEAKADGCLCQGEYVFQFRHVNDGGAVYVMHVDCPLHGRSAGRE